LKKAEERSKELLDRQLDKQDEIGTAITNLAMIDFNEISINQTITILLDATKKNCSCSRSMESYYSIL